VTPGERLSQVRDTVTSLRKLDGPDLYTPVVMAVRGPKAQALAADFRATRDVELALHPSLNSVVTNPLTSPTARCASPRAGRASRSRRQPRGCRRYATTRKDGIHQLRHYYASIMLAGGVSTRS
jgi:hypothetical protein